MASTIFLKSVEITGDSMSCNLSHKLTVSYIPKGSMTATLAYEGTNFLCRRFFDTWNILRTDITINSLLGRDNLIMFDDDQICAWLGVEANGEITNACVEMDILGEQY